MNLPENVVAGTHNTEDGLSRRLGVYREQNTEDDTILNYFDEMEIHPNKIGAFVQYIYNPQWWKLFNSYNTRVI